VNILESRQDIDRCIAEGDFRKAATLLPQLWAAEPTNSTAAFVVQRFEQLRSHLSLRPFRLAILRSFTVEPIVPLLRASAFCSGIDLTLHLSDFNAYVQAITDGQSSLYAFQPDAVILAVQTRDVAPDLWNNFGALNAEDSQKAIARLASEFRAWIQAFRRQSAAHLVVHNLEQPTSPSRGVLDQQLEQSQSEAIRTVNRELAMAAGGFSGVYVLDYDGLVARHGREQWHDERKWLTVRLPIAADHLGQLATEWMRFLHPMAGKVAKALVVDLDNTLWGGVIGEDGMAGIRLGTEYPGAAFQELQRALLDLYQRGILLAVCSKNNLDDAMEALEKHPGMILRPTHFAAMRINWLDKAQNLREIANELNIGTDALAFLDDNPIERQQVRSELPEVAVINLPSDPMSYARIVREFPMFERLTLSTEDFERGKMYQEQREREQLEQTLSSREDFYRSLKQEAEIAPVTPATLARVAQLTNKTNQFNLTTRRYSEQQITDLAASPEWECFSIRVRDRFGDNGLVGVAILRIAGSTCEIDTFLLSCRVIGRTVETAFLSFLADRARTRGARRLQGWFLPTKKNAPARDFYANHGFTASSNNGKGTLWTLDLAENALPCPEWVNLQIMDGEKTLR
jgi:FkbH-like protein